MSTHNICFLGEIRKILCGYPLLSVAMDCLFAQSDIGVFCFYLRLMWPNYYHYS